MNFKKFIALICALTFVFSNLINVSADYIVKAICLGDSGVGKTSVLNTLVKRKFDEGISSTIGVKYMMCKKYGNNKLQFWDTGGQKKYRSIIPSYCKQSDIAVICVDSTAPIKTITEKIDSWGEFANAHCPKGVKLILVATKKDEDTNDNLALIEKKAEERHMEFCSVSAKTDDGMDGLEKLLKNTATEVVVATGVPIEDALLGDAPDTPLGHDTPWGYDAPYGDGTAETTATTKTLTPLLVAGIVTGITAAVGLIATVVHLAKSRLPANRPQPKLA
ncbi:MAG: GTP-binding protein [Oscillospiraceae bacterium]|jgi:Ras-related protein Rab-6A|nr:GTP-binding protein [Oscillospiraceae bacterium]